MAKNIHAQILGSKGGFARKAKLSKEQLSEIGRKGGKLGGWPKGTKRGPRKPKIPTPSAE